MSDRSATGPTLRCREDPNRGYRSIPHMAVYSPFTGDTPAPEWER